ncbi:hypothetical protein LTR56_010868 [Elasticomyces elasticus]|nr:hypothetical protein LTR56_010868 [Elasticomyces elasticus]KAK4911850.1 hypothetical protein LTR49_019650 [Elasticomyces elasticus]KAK5768278.1 hypothetical protein LTS12_001417 [Elasticomyces elasticus]
MRVLNILLGLLLGIASAVEQAPLLQHGDTGRNVSQVLYAELEELARIVDISYCVGLTIPGIYHPFTCLSRCSDFPRFELVTTWNTGPLLSDSCGYIALDHSKQRIVVAFRGTYSIANTVIDLSTIPQEYVPYPGSSGNDDDEPKCEGCRVHMGFHASWLITRLRILNDLEKQMLLWPGYKLTLVGHSLGGAVAALAGLDLLARGYDPTVTTFGEPRVGNKNLTSYLDERFFLRERDGRDDTEMKYRRVTHIDDPVPLLPLSEWGFAMHAGEIYISKPDLSPDVQDLEHCEGDSDGKCIAGQDSTIAGTQGLGKRDLLASVAEEIDDVKHEPWGVPSRYKLWQLFFAHRDYFWRLGLCVPGGDPLGGGGNHDIDLHRSMFRDGKHILISGAALKSALTNTAELRIFALASNSMADHNEHQDFLDNPNNLPNPSPTSSNSDLDLTDFFLAPSHQPSPEFSPFDLDDLLDHEAITEVNHRARSPAHEHPVSPHSAFVSPDVPPSRPHAPVNSAINPDDLRDRERIFQSHDAERFSGPSQQSSPEFSPFDLDDLLDPRIYSETDDQGRYLAPEHPVSRGPSPVISDFISPEPWSPLGTQCPPNHNTVPPQPNPDDTFLSVCLPREVLFATSLPGRDKWRIVSDYNASLHILNDPDLPQGNHKRIDAREKQLAIFEVCIEVIQAKLKWEETKLAENIRWVRRASQWALGGFATADNLDLGGSEADFAMAWNDLTRRREEYDDLRVTLLRLREEFANAGGTIDPRWLEKDTHADSIFEEQSLLQWAQQHHPQEEVAMEELTFTRREVPPPFTGNCGPPQQVFLGHEGVRGRPDLWAGASSSNEHSHNNLPMRPYTRFSGAGIAPSRLETIYEEDEENEEEDDAEGAGPFCSAGEVHSAEEGGQQSTHGTRKSKERAEPLNNRNPPAVPSLTTLHQWQVTNPEPQATPPESEVGHSGLSARAGVPTGRDNPGHPAGSSPPTAIADGSDAQYLVDTSQYSDLPFLNDSMSHARNVSHATNLSGTGPPEWYLNGTTYVCDSGNASWVPKLFEEDDG